MNFFTKTFDWGLNWYGKYERPVTSISLFTGFIFDLITISRLDATWTSLYIMIHLVLIGVFIVLIHKHTRYRDDETDPTKPHFWYVNALQFLFGGILSTFLISYFRSTDIFVTWPFLLILLLAFVSNEVLKRHYIRLSFQISLYFLSIFSFSIFIIPIVLHRLGVWVFLLSGLVSLLYISLFIYILFKIIKDKFSDSKKSLAFLIGGFFIFINFLYFTNLIPPIPLSLKDAGVFHSIERDSMGNYVATFENLGWKGYFQFYKNIRVIPGETIYVYSAIFSPTNLNTTVLHEYRYLDEASGDWVTHSTISLDVIGGRDGGFRTFSTTNSLTPGKWMVNVLTTRGQLIGRIRFNVIKAGIPPRLDVTIKS